MGVVERNTWRNMKYRCHNPGNKNYPDYGGRGVTVCENWLESFENFYADMGPRPEGKSLDRINNDLGYFKENCRWATPAEQMANRRVTYVLNGVPQTLDSIAAWFFCSDKTVRNYIKRHNGDSECAWNDLAIFRELGLRRQSEADQKTGERIREVGAVASNETPSGQGAATLQAMWGTARSQGDEGSREGLPAKTKWSIGIPGRKGRPAGETERVTQNRLFAIFLKLQGTTYHRIGEILGVTNQRATQLVQPPDHIKQVILGRCGRHCERCAQHTPVGYFHHVTIQGKTELTFNLPDNLEYLCCFCHSRHHNDPSTHLHLGYTPIPFRERGRRGGSSRSATKIMAARKNVLKAAAVYSEIRPRGTR